MKRAISYSVISLLLVFTLAGTYMACKTPNPQPEKSTPDNETSPTRQIQPEQTVPKKPATFEVGELDISPTCMVGETIPVKTTIINVGDEPGMYTAIFTVNGEEVDRELISISAGNSEDVSFEFIGQDTGLCELAIGESNTSVTLYGWEPCEIRYENGVIKQQCYYYFEGDDGHAVLFEPEVEVFKVQKIRICGMSSVVNLNELKERQFTVSIWDKYRASMLWSEEFPWQLFKGSLGWIDVEVPDVCVDDDFMVEFISHSEPFRAEGNRQIYTCIAIAWERNESEEVHSGVIVDGGIYGTSDYNWFIRVEGECSQIF